MYGKHATNNEIKFCQVARNCIKQVLLYLTESTIIRNRSLKVYLFNNELKIVENKILQEMIIIIVWFLDASC